MTDARARWELYLHSGIPIIHIEGDWDETISPLLAETVMRLAGCGHLEIIINLSGLKRLPLAERHWRDGLERLAVSLRDHCGRLDVVGTAEQVEAGLRRSVRSLVRWATSDEEAICHIKGVPLAVSSPRLISRLANR